MNVFVVEDSTNAALRAVFADRENAEDFARQVTGAIVYERTVRAMAPKSHWLAEVSNIADWLNINGHQDLAAELTFREQNKARHTTRY